MFSDKYLFHHRCKPVVIYTDDKHTNMTDPTPRKYSLVISEFRFMYYPHNVFSCCQSDKKIRTPCNIYEI